MEHKEFQTMVDTIWKRKLGNDPMDNIWQNLQQLKTETKGLNREMTSYEIRLNQIRQQLEYTQINLKLDPFNQDLIEKEKQTLQELEKWSIIEERVLKQKARVNWIDYGDSNSKYFYAQLKIRASKNSITTVYNDMGARVTEPKAVEKEFITFFKQLMGTDSGIKPCPNTKFIKARVCLSLEQQQELIKEVTYEEVDEAVKDIPNYKAPGVDDFQ
ncbi:PREDICTED: uncharacterized protein LOC109218817 [Nicotiana attenuata]|uniref:uncharacterized protein LOC109218817 n=1 Tax=Nicotiana attenuata TaxID=49451 RepID=UPI000905045A|nr:PREDICTED: uncharacterized protein LOC109218817 [Nicotiana attenuata]